MKAEKIEKTVTMTTVYQYERAAFGYGMETAYIYGMVDEDGNEYVWKTTSFMALKVEDEKNGWEIDAKGRKWSYLKINKGDIVQIKAGIKRVGEYNGKPQTELTRVKVVKRVFAAETWEEKQERIRKENEEKAKVQLNTLKDGDFIWEMPYRQFKTHYDDCETVANSYDKERKTIAVIIRVGRLKASGVRGEHYSGYELENEAGSHIVYRAVKEENAIKRATKEFGGNWECVKIYNYK